MLCYKRDPWVTGGLAERLDTAMTSKVNTATLLLALSAHRRRNAQAYWREALLLAFGNWT